MSSSNESFDTIAKWRREKWCEKQQAREQGRGVTVGSDDDGEEEADGGRILFVCACLVSSTGCCLLEWFLHSISHLLWQILLLPKHRLKVRGRALCSESLRVIRVARLPLGSGCHASR